MQNIETSVSASLSIAGPRVIVAAEEDRAVVRTPHRAVLLYLLARRLADDRASGLLPEDEGWLPDSELRIGIWGRQAAGLVANNINVLIHRTRKQLNQFDLQIEKIPNYTRLRCHQVKVA